MKNEIKNTKLKLPIELISDLILFIPFNIKWTKIRISKIFDLFIIKYQRKWIISLILLKENATKRFAMIVECLDGMNKDLKDSNISRKFLIDFNGRLNGIYDQFQGIGKVAAQSLCGKINMLVKKVEWPDVDKGFDDVKQVKTNFLDKKRIIIGLFNDLKVEVYEMKDSGELERLDTALTMIIVAVEGISKIYQEKA
ncbi:hypothetical protein ACQ4LE_007474 [Meloidogyne hapla]